MSIDLKPRGFNTYFAFYSSFEYVPGVIRFMRSFKGHHDVLPNTEIAFKFCAIYSKIR